MFYYYSDQSGGSHSKESTSKNIKGRILWKSQASYDIAIYIYYIFFRFHDEIIVGIPYLFIYSIFLNRHYIL